MIKIISNKVEWDEWLSQMDYLDFYHTYDYHQLFCTPSEMAILIAYENGNTRIGLPMVKRNLGNGYYDLTSVHGYVGPIYKNVDCDIDNTNFSKKLKNILQKEKIVTVFSKLNPYIPMQNTILENIGQTENVGELVYFDQTANDEDQCSAYNRNTRQILKKLKKTSKVKVGNTESDIETFIAHYHKSLDRLKAKQLFYFGAQYFKTLAESDFFSSEVLFTVDSETDEIMAGALLIQSKKIAHIELAFSVEKYFKSSPLRLLFDECRQRSKKEGTTVLNLGGGIGGREGSLMKFKSSFSQNYAKFNVWKYIVEPDVYKSMLTQEQKDADTNFFPKYRLETA
ncbi:GNAT family N-acetyltransferase [Flagellimonas nanhaiensis]|uniref:GNAT family N-acetyltransferase n=1 Tax=Flagellimonas nanhaiensis TaxID=2292706 RepID=A0A371JKW8_9FLAO|nr:GNAT family N-acetyltransferase [Allomuricauda nanhaiensis]RDY57578.1 GNAT family N-acetyltransferase [Allomuricauda nanhaiensis]